MSLTTVGRFSAIANAVIAKNYLESLGIACQLAGETAFESIYGYPLSDVQLQVEEEDVARAEEALATIEDDAESDAAGSAIVGGKCCECGAEVEPGFDVCWSCGKSLEAKE